MDETFGLHDLFTEDHGYPSLLWPFGADADGCVDPSLELSALNNRQGVQDAYPSVFGPPELALMVPSFQDINHTCTNETAQHTAPMTGVSETPTLIQFSCCFCPRQFKRRSDAKRHQRTVHEKRGQLLCPEQACPRPNRLFSRKDNLKAHLSKVHGKSLHGPSKKRETYDETVVVSERCRQGSGSSRMQDLETRTRPELMAMLLSQREEFWNERLKRLEAELEILRRKGGQRHDLYQGDE
ncbi:hypothetical protein PT974_10794 [Cladobotryum mycophilum]|uniref:C2H2-type domain-containing protein n=1 Tax=Cladobotryum mycophilum TaxID=491253 RepID=A0ABR0SAX3_9HYPO